MTRIAILGSGTVGQTLARGIKALGNDVRIGTRTPEKLAEFSNSTGVAAVPVANAAEWGETIVLAVLGRAAAEVLHAAGDANVSGKVVIDATNPIADEPPEDGVLRSFLGSNDSLMEGLQAAFPTARFVKAFNSVGAAVMVRPSFARGRPTMFICGNDDDAKRQVERLLEQLGWDWEDMGTAKAARAIEPLAQLWCIPGFREGVWTHAFRLLRV